MAMDAKIGRFFDAVGSFFSGGENIPWCDRDVIAVRAEPIHSLSTSPRTPHPLSTSTTTLVA